DGYSGEISRKGHGLQRALILTLLQELAKISNSEEDNSTDYEPELILAIEEAELYQHPMKAKYLNNLFKELTQSTEDKKASNQILLTTHSPYFVDVKNFDQLVMIRKVAEPPFTVPFSKAQHQTVEYVIKELERINSVGEGTFSRKSTIARIIPVMTTIVNEGFFAEAIVLVEGMSDASALSTLDSLLKYEWVRKGIHIIPVEGKNNIDRPTIIFRGFGIPTYYIFDGDKKEGSNVVNSNIIYQKLSRETEIEEHPTTQVHKDWAVFEETLETEIMNSIGKETYVKLREAVAKDLGYPKPSLVEKNSEGISRLIFEIYKAGYKIEVLEDICARINQMVSE
ncbi:MAG: AAA family ATPase, partial [bacterium]